MLSNYLTVGLRNLAKNKTYTFINVFGLALGLAAFLLILIFVRYELSYDNWIPGSDRVFQFQTSYKDDGHGQTELNMQNASYISGTLLKKDFPQIEKLVYLGHGRPVIMQDGQASTTDDFFYVDGNLLDVLPFPLVKGDARTALNSPGSVVLTESEAAKRFGSTNPMGRTLTFVDRGKTYDYHVTGVLKDLPKNTHMSIGMLARYDPFSYWGDDNQMLTQWGWNSGYFYGKLRPGADLQSINSQFPAWKKRNIPDDVVDGQRSNRGDIQDWMLVNISDVHLGKAQGGAMTPGNDRRSIITFAVIGVLVLGMACVNFTNLATARAGQRAREVALRKVLGATRSQLVTQFLAESILVAMLSMLVALAMVELTLPALDNFLEADMRMTYFGSQGLLLPIIALVFVVGAAGGAYPAFFLSRFQPAKVLKANKSAADAQGSGKLRNILVVSQFAVSIGLIICTAVVYAQTVYARTVDPGYKRDGLIQVGNVARRQMVPLVPTLIHELKAVDGVKAVGRSQIGIATNNSSNTGVTGPGQTEPQTTGVYAVDTGFFETMGIPIVAGRNFSEARPIDDSTLEGYPPSAEAQTALTRRGYSVILNELAVKAFGFKSAQEALGKVLRAQTSNADKDGTTPVTVVGVVKDSRFRSVREPVEPIMFSYNRVTPDTLVVRYGGANPSLVRERIQHVWKRIAPDVPFEAKFSDEIVRKLYRTEASRASMFAASAGLAVVIGCLGLFGLASFTAERRTKEIGIRKVLGARTQDIVRLLVWQFSQPVLIANIIAWPIAWWVMRDWLNGFDARIGLNPVLFVGAGALALAIAAITIIGHAMKVARANPIHALRYE